MSRRPIRVLVVDDAVVIRRIVSDVLGEDPEIEIVGTAANGRIALQKITQVNPDILTLDVEMPEMDGLQTLRELRKTHPRLPVIMFSTLTERGATATIEALTCGASDYVTKPANIGSVGMAQQRLREELIPKIKSLCQVPATVVPLRHLTPVTRASEAAPPLTATGMAGAIDVMAVGVSTGGPNALACVIPQLPAGLPVPIVLVQHMPPMFTKLLAERLNSQSALEILEARGGEELTAGRVYIAPGDYHMVVQRKGLRIVTALNQAPPENSCRPAVDVLFRSVCDVYGGRTLAVIMTGMGQDGLRGCEDVKRCGGSVVVQDEASSVVWGMPGFVARAGLADAVVPLAEIASEVSRRIRGSHARVSLAAAR
ncbi:MAG: chemotaxis response regulator protein-glutamate methylesterase [Vicinamibacterales bacterium]|nr:chemotaxis response regulator protein-glutamate methylesterase [Vicinamibacterales bacterium]